MNKKVIETLSIVLVMILTLILPLDKSFVTDTFAESQPQSETVQVSETGEQATDTSQTEETTEESEVHQEVYKTPLDHLKEIRIGWSNALVFVILIGILVGKKLKEYLDEKQKESK